MEGIIPNLILVGRHCRAAEERDILSPSYIEGLVVICASMEAGTAQSSVTTALLEDV